MTNNTKTPHVHAALIKAWADGATIEYQSSSGTWTQTPSPNWNPNSKYRVKPEPKPDITLSVSVMRVSNTAYIVAFKHNLKLTFDGETDKLKSAEMIKDECA